MSYERNFQLEENIMKLYSCGAEAIFFFDANGNILATNPVVEKLFVLEEGHLEHKRGAYSICSICKGYMNSGDTASCVECFLTCKDKDFSSFQLYMEKRDGTIVPFSASYKSIDCQKNIFVLTLLDLTRQSEMRETLYRSNMTKHIIKAQEDERKRISRELHDSVAQELLSSLVDIRVLKYMSLPESATKKMTEIEHSLSRLLEEIRNLSVELRPASLDDLGLEAAFRSHFKWVKEHHGVIIQFKSELSAARYSSEIETVVYRICQEAILNIIKYADVDEAVVRLYEQDENLHLYIIDRGTGFDQRSKKEPKGTGLGLYGMQERADLVNGTLDIQAALGSGVEIRLEIPIK